MSLSMKLSGSPSRAAMRERSPLNTRARPVKTPSFTPPSTPATLRIAPPAGARLPRSRRSPPVSLKGFSTEKITPPSGGGGSSRRSCWAKVSPGQVVKVTLAQHVVPEVQTGGASDLNAVQQHVRGPAHRDRDREGVAQRG